MSSKRKSPPTKLDGSCSVAATDLSVHVPSSPHHHYHPTQLDLSIKSESHESESRISPLDSHPYITADMAESLNYLNSEVLKSKRRSDPNQFHNTEQSHSLQNLLAKRRKSENFHNDDNVPSLNSPPPPHHHNNSLESVSNFFQARHDEIQSQIKNEQQNGSDNEEFNNNNNNNNNHIETELKRELMVPSKKTMNDVLKVLTNKMKGSSIKDSRKRSINECNDGDEGKKYDG